MLAVVGAVVIVTKQGDSDGCSAKYRTDKTIRIGKYQVKAEVVKTAEEQQKGLSGRPCIGASRGMLFVFPKAGHYSVWMKDMKFPIDIAWIGSDYKVVGLEKNVATSTYPDSFVNKDRLAQYVLELQAGRADSLGITIGTKVDF